MKLLGTIAFWLVILGGLALGYEALTDRDLIHTVFRGSHQAGVLLKGAIGVAALIILGGKIKG